MEAFLMDKEHCPCCPNNCAKDELCCPNGVQYFDKKDEVEEKNNEKSTESIEIINEKEDE